MKGLILREPFCLEAADFDHPGEPGPGEALVRVRHIGVCGTDIHAFQGNQPFFSYPRVLGHELGVEVLAVGAGISGISIGQRCCVEPYLNCGTCIACRSGKTNCCVKLSVLGVHSDGGHKEEILVPAHKLHPSSVLTTEQLALVEPLGIGAHAVQRAQIIAGETICVIGAGPIGLGVIQFAKAAGAHVIVVDVSASRLAFSEALGVEATINAASQEVRSSLTEMTQGDMPTVVFDATGSAKSMAASFDFVAHGGRLVFVGLFRGELTFNDPDFHRRELSLLASRNACAADFPHIIRLIEDGKVDTAPWITHRAEMADVPLLFSDWCKAETGVLKAMISMN